MKTHRVSTTISQKHWELLKKHAEKFKTQQKALELALESLENSSKQSPVLNPEEKYWITLKWANSLVIVEKTAFKLLIETADIERLNELFIQDKPIEYAIEFYLQKPLKECNLKEFIDGLVISTRITNWFDTIDYTDDGSHYTLRMTHDFGFTLSRLTVMLIESALKTYGVNAESVTSARTIFIKIFKNQ